MLIRAGRPLEAKQVLEKLGDDAAQLDTGLGRLATVASLLGGELKERTLKLATAAAGKDINDYQGRLWFGEVSWAAGDRGQAEAAFRQAIKDKPTAPEAWKALLLCLVDERRKDQAGTELDNARKALPADQAAGVLAVGLEALGRRNEAEEQYLIALKAQPDAARLRDAAAFYLRGGDVKKAESLLHRLIDDEGRDDPAAAAWGRRSLALAWASTGDYKQSQAALDLLDENLRSRKTPEDERAKALVLASRPGGRPEAIQQLETSFVEKRPTPDEEFLLARLYEANGEWGQANQHFLSVVGSKKANPLYLAYYVTALLRHNDVQGAARYMQDLEKADPDSLRTAAAKVRVLQRRATTRRPSGRSPAARRNSSTRRRNRPCWARRPRCWSSWGRTTRPRSFIANTWRRSRTSTRRSASCWRPSWPGATAWASRWTSSTRYGTNLVQKASAGGGGGAARRPADARAIPARAVPRRGRRPGQPRRNRPSGLVGGLAGRAGPLCRGDQFVPDHPRRQPAQPVGPEQPGVAAGVPGRQAGGVGGAGGAPR